MVKLRGGKKRGFAKIISAVMLLAFISALIFCSAPSGPYYAAADGIVIEEVSDGGVYVGRAFNKDYDFILDDLSDGFVAQRLCGESFFCGEGVEITCGGYASRNLSDAGKASGRKYKYAVIKIDGIINPDGIFVTLKDSSGMHLGTKSLFQLKGPDGKPIPYSISEPTGFVIDPQNSGYRSGGDLAEVIIDAIEGASVVLKQIFLTDMEGPLKETEQPRLNPLTAVKTESAPDESYGGKNYYVLRLSGTEGSYTAPDGVYYKLFKKDEATAALDFYNRNKSAVSGAFYCDGYAKGQIRPDISAAKRLNTSVSENGVEFFSDTPVNERFLKIDTRLPVERIKVNFYFIKDLMTVESGEYSLSLSSKGYKTIEGRKTGFNSMIFDLRSAGIEPYGGLSISGGKGIAVSSVPAVQEYGAIMQKIEADLFTPAAAEEDAVENRTDSRGGDYGFLRYGNYQFKKA